jgi:hypothetical protein
LKTIFIAVILLIFLGIANASSLQGYCKDCLKENLFFKIVQSLLNNDEEKFDDFLKKGCVVVKSGSSISIPNRKQTREIKLLAYVGENETILCPVY